MNKFINIKSFITGTIIAICLTLVSFLLGIKILGNIYYTASLLPFCLFSCLTISWFVFLKNDGLGKRYEKRQNSVTNTNNTKTTPIDISNSDASSTNTQLGQYKDPQTNVQSQNTETVPNLELFAPLSDTIVPRHPLPEQNQNSRKKTKINISKALLWAAIELGIIATALYFFGDIGAKFYK